MTLTPDQAVDAINARFGHHPRARALHAKGLWLRGHFTASAAAASLCRAEHLQGRPVPVLARVSNGSGDPNSADYEPNVRGLLEHVADHNPYAGDPVRLIPRTTSQANSRGSPPAAAEIRTSSPTVWCSSQALPRRT